MRITLLLCIMFLCGCQSVHTLDTVTPDGFMIGQGVGPKADGTFIYVNWGIPQPSSFIKSD